jgi:hypothetical protein
METKEKVPTNDLRIELQLRGFLAGAKLRVTAKRFSQQTLDSFNS